MSSELMGQVPGGMHEPCDADSPVRTQAKVDHGCCQNRIDELPCAKPSSDIGVRETLWRWKALPLERVRFRFIALAGAARGAAKAGHPQEARSYYGQLLKITGGGSSSRPEIDTAPTMYCRQALETRIMDVWFPVNPRLGCRGRGRIGSLISANRRLALSVMVSSGKRVLGKGGKANSIAFPPRSSHFFI